MQKKEKISEIPTYLGEVGEGRPGEREGKTTRQKGNKKTFDFQIFWRRGKVAKQKKEPAVALVWMKRGGGKRRSKKKIIGG